MNNKANVKYIDFTNDFEQLSEIWHACFPDDADFAEDFLRYAAPLCVGLAVYVDNAPVSMAFFIPSTICTANEKLSAYYVYGVGTLPAHRGNGYAGLLLKEAQKTLACDMLYLCPAKPTLVGFYENLGYRVMLSYDTVTADAVFCGDTPTFSVTDFCADAYAKLRDRFLHNGKTAYAVFDDNILQVMLAHAKILTFAQGTALCIVDDTVVYLPEVLCDDVELPCVIAAVKKRYPEKKIVAYTAGENDTRGMVLPCSTKAKTFFDTKKIVPFFGSFFAE